MNDEINLLTTKKNNYDPSVFKRMELLRFIAIGALFVVSVMSFILFILITFSPLPSLQQEERELLAKFSQSELGAKMSKYYITQNRLSDIATVIKKRTDVVALYALLRSNLSTDAKIDILSISNKTVTMTVSGPTLDSIDDSITKLQQAEKNNKVFKNFTLSRIAYTSGVSDYLAFFQITLL